MLLALTVLAMNSSFLAVEFCVIVPSTSEAHRGVPVWLGTSLPMPAVCPNLDLTPLLPFRGRFGSPGSLSMCIWGGPRL